jgi:hypothetical protein
VFGFQAVTIRVQGIAFNNKKSQGHLRADHETCEKILENGANFPQNDLQGVPATESKKHSDHLLCGNFGGEWGRSTKRKFGILSPRRALFKSLLVSDPAHIFMFSQLNPIGNSLNFLILNQWLKSLNESLLLPKPVPLYTTPNISLTNLTSIQRHQSVIKSTRNLIEESSNTLPKCVPPKIICQSSSNKSTKQLPKQAGSKTTSKSSRLSYAREYKLMVIDYFAANGQNKYRTCKRFKITKSMLNGWLLKAEKIMNSRPGALKTGCSGRKPQFPNMEEQLYKLYLERQSQGHQVSN